jgi:hypothetical protein
MAILIIGVVIHILDHVRIEHCKRSLEGWIIVRNFLVLYPEISFQDLGCRHEPEYVYIAFRKSASESSPKLLGSRIAFIHQQSGYRSQCCPCHT